MHTSAMHTNAMHIAIGTRKGLWTAVGGTSEAGATWEVSRPIKDMAEFASVAWLPQAGGNPRLIVGARSWFWGPTTLMSDDFGATWTEPEAGAITFPADTGAALERVWTMTPDPVEESVVWAGGEPHSLWRSADRGTSFEFVRGLWDHPHRPEWGPGAGGPAVHVICRRPDGSTVLAMSSGGVYRSADGLTGWEAANRGIRADFMPEGEQYPEFNQCVHRLAVDGANPQRLYVQNHGGVYRSDDSGDSWMEITAGLPASEFGFVVLAHPTKGDTIWVIPILAETMLPAQGQLRVWKSEDAGQTWAAQGDGLPDNFYAAVLRDAAHVIPYGDDAALVFGTRNGHVYASLDGGATFDEVARDLPDVLSVRLIDA